MQGRRRTTHTPGHQLQPGDYCETSQDGAKFYVACTPDGRLANLKNHHVTENSDGTISVFPSILVTGGGNEGQWHGFLERGVWREV